MQFLVVLLLNCVSKSILLFDLPTYYYTSDVLIELLNYKASFKLCFFTDKSKSPFIMKMVF